MEHRIATYEVLDKAGGVALAGELYVYDDGKWCIPESIRHLPVGDYVFKIADLDVAVAVIDPDSLPTL